MSTPAAVARLDLDALPKSTRRAFDLEVTPLGDGTTLSVPVNVIQGARSGPCLAAVAGVHGDEVDGIMALLDLWDELAPDHLAGRLVMVPVANPAAFAAGRRRSPLDDLDLNRIFPGRADGQPSEQLAHCLFSRVLALADFVFSMHGWYSSGVVLPYVEFDHARPATAPASYRAAVASGFEVIRIGSWSPGLMTRVANESGIPGMEAEVGGMGTSRAENRARYKRHVVALMQHLGMYDGAPAPNPSSRLVEHFDVVTPIGGVVRIAADLGSEVQKGTLLATVHDLHGAVIHEVRSPGDGMVAAHWTFASARPGTHLFRLFRDVDRSVISGL